METMQALVKKEAKPGLWLDEVPAAQDRDQRRAHQGAAHRHLRYRCSYRNLGCLGAEDDSGADGGRPRVCGRDRRDGIERQGFPRRRDRQRRGTRRLRPVPQLPGGRRHLCKDTKGVGVNRPGAFAEYLSLPMTNVWAHDPNIPRDVQSIFDPFGNAVHTALQFDVLGEDVLITGAGPIGIMAVSVVRHAGARHVVITDVNPYRLELARKMGATLAVDVREKSIAERPERAGHEGRV